MPLTRGTTRATARLVAIAVVALAGVLAGCDWRGPDPTEASVTAPLGPFDYATTTVGTGHGFGGGTIYYPTDTTAGDFGAVAISPGFLMYQSTMAWYGPRLASQGFVVITIDTNSVYDAPPSRGTQLLAALDYLTEDSTVADRIDPERLAVMGWSMGGGGALEASVSRPSLRASIPLAPWHTIADWSAVTVPTLVVGCEADTLATVDQHAVPFYESLPDTIRSGYLEIAGGDHFCVAYANDTIARQVISFLKRNLDSDTRYSQFLCPAPSIGGAVSDSRSTCPY